MNKDTNRFDEFAERFVRLYWQDVIDNAHKLPPHEPCKESLDELLAATTIKTSREAVVGESGQVFALRMVDAFGSSWRFVFKHDEVRWHLLEAFANDEEDDRRRNMLDVVYGQYFRETLYQITSLATR